MSERPSLNGPVAAMAAEVADVVAPAAELHDGALTTARGSTMLISDLAPMAAPVAERAVQTPVAPDTVADLAQRVAILEAALNHNTAALERHIMHIYGELRLKPPGG